MKRVAIVQPRIVEYRVGFYLGLERALRAHDVALSVFAGRCEPGSGHEEGLGRLSFAHPAAQTRFGAKAYWQSAFRLTADQDLVIVDQANAALLNHALFASRWLRRRPSRVAFWGHGATFQPDESGPLRAAFKHALARTADHWFAYTPLSRDRVLATGYPAEHITTVYNSADTTGIAAARLRVHAEGKGAARRRLGLPEGGALVVFCSRLYPGKKLDLLIEACSLARRSLPNLSLAVIGEGPLSGWLAEQAQTRPWICQLGSLYGDAKSDVLTASDLLAMPALVGLSILDGFAAGLPCLTSDLPGHGPELAYLEPGVNGIITGPDAYAHGLVQILSDAAGLERLSQGAANTASRYSLDNMVMRFSEGVLLALADRETLRRLTA